MDDIAKGTKLKYEEFPVDFLCIKVPPTIENGLQINRLYLISNQLIVKTIAIK